MYRQAICQEGAFQAYGSIEVLPASGFCVETTTTIPPTPVPTPAPTPNPTPVVLVELSSSTLPPVPMTSSPAPSDFEPGAVRESEESGGLSAGAIVFVVLGALILLFDAVALGYILHRHYRSKRAVRVANADNLAVQDAP